VKEADHVSATVVERPYLSGQSLGYESRPSLLLLPGSIIVFITQPPRHLACRPQAARLAAWLPPSLRLLLACSLSQPPPAMLHERGSQPLPLPLLLYNMSYLPLPLPPGCIRQGSGAPTGRPSARDAREGDDAQARPGAQEGGEERN
jgi:hypothetical protein